MKEKICMSACLAGIPCRMDGKTKTIPALKKLYEEGNVILVCPEQLGGLPTPRPASEIRGERVINTAGADVTEKFHRGAEEAMRIYQENNCTKAILKARSPSCGCGEVYDGTFTHTVIKGNGIFAQKLIDAGIPIETEEKYKK